MYLFSKQPQFAGLKRLLKKKKKKKSSDLSLTKPFWQLVQIQTGIGDEQPPAEEFQQELSRF